jgi:hypothetical protein
MSKIASFTTAFATASIISISTAVSAFACDNYVGTASQGFGNRSVTETWGDQYVSVDQDGDWNSVRDRIQGHCNGVVTGQYGDGDRANTNIAGQHNAVGMRQTADDVSARADVVGNGNGIASYQSRPGSHAEFDVRGGRNHVVNIQH